ncbi:hypothetical protein Tco_0856947 [Tanacetum coccineum]|uniref:Uncharacterized protein n=1 Tax=Tanacetum coccineum TaxID=301880 RepID=A0ABQ5B4Y0_9ASTR
MGGAFGDDLLCVWLWKRGLRLGGWGGYGDGWLWVGGGWEGGAGGGRDDVAQMLSDLIIMRVLRGGGEWVFEGLGGLGLLGVWESKGASAVGMVEEVGGSSQETAVKGFQVASLCNALLEDGGIRGGGDCTGSGLWYGGYWMGVGVEGVIVGRGGGGVGWDCRGVTGYRSPWGGGVGWVGNGIDLGGGGGMDRMVRSRVRYYPSRKHSGGDGGCCRWAEIFWATAKANTVNGERQLQALIDKKKVIITESSIRSDLHLEDAGAFFSLQWKFLIHTITQCLSAKSTAWNEFSSTMASLIICLATNQNFNLSKYIFDAMVKHLDGGVKFLMYPRFVQVFINQQLGDMSHHKKIYVNPSHTKKIFANMKREGKDFSGRVTPLFATMMVQANQEEGVDSGIPTASQQTPITILPSTSKPQKKQSRRKQKKTNAVPHPSDSTTDVPNEEFVPTHSNDLLLSGEDRLKLTDLMDMCTKLSERVLDLEHTKTAQAQEITNLKLRVKKLEKKAGLRTHKFKRLYKVGVTRRVEYSNDESLGAQEDASKQGRNALIGNEVFAENDMIEKDQDVIPKEVSTAAPSTTAVSPPVITKVEITLAQTLAKLKSAKSKVVIQEPVQSTTTTAPLTIPKAKGITFRDASESTTRIPTSVSSSSIKDKRKAKMDEPEVPLKKKDQIALDEEMARNLEAQIQAELIEEERLTRKKEEEANIALIESWDNTQAMMEADFKLAQRLQAEEQGEITIEERSRLFVELMNKRKKHFAKLKAEEKRRKPPTKAQKRNLMSTYLKNMGGYKYNQLKSKSYDEIQELFDNEIKRVNTFIPMDSEVMKSKEGTEESSKRTEDELETDKSKKAESSEKKVEGSRKKSIDEHEEAEEDDEAEMKKHMEIVQDDEEIAIDAIPLATKPPIIVEYKIVKEGQKGFYHFNSLLEVQNKNYQ